MEYPETLEQLDHRDTPGKKVIKESLDLQVLKGRQVPLVLPDHQDHEVFVETKVQPVQQETTDPSVYQDNLVPVELKDQREPQVRLALLDQKVLQEMLGHKENKEQLACQDLLVLLVSLVLQVSMEMLDFKDQWDHQDHQDHEEPEDQQVQLDQSVPQDQKVLWENRAVEVLQVLKELQEPLVVLDQLDPLVTKDGKEKPVHLEHEVQQELQEREDHRDLLESLVNQVWLVLRVTLGQVAQKEKLDTKEQPDHAAETDLKVLSEQLDQLEAQEPQDGWERQERLDQTEKMVLLDHKV